ncbi:MAG TPA: cupin domain-containing protein [Burkholderiales bacterium]|nr:cupin domain-containing protein [Burkholderiales bacterium]
MTEPRAPIFLPPGEGRDYPMGRIRALFKADRDETAGLYSISEWWLEPRTKGPGAHSHAEDDVFYVIEGTMSFLLGERWVEAPAGSFVLAPGGVTHDFENRGPVRAGALNLSCPGGFEKDMPEIAAWFGEHPPGEPEEPAAAPVAPITEANPTVAEMEARVARFAALRPTDDYVDAGIPGCERTTLRVLGEKPHAPLQAESYHMNLVRCAPGKSAPLHNHLTQEVFMPLSGTWEVFWGPEGARSLRLSPYDVISVPPGVSRGFRNAGTEEALLMGIAAGRDPGMINWPETVRAAARAAGVLLPA